MSDRRDLAAGLRAAEAEIVRLRGVIIDLADPDGDNITIARARAAVSSPNEWLADAADTSDIAEAEAYANAGPALSRKTAGRLASALRAAEAIATDLAATIPYEDGSGFCHYGCESIGDDDSHAESCVWRRARAAVSSPSEATP